MTPNLGAWLERPQGWKCCWFIMKTMAKNVNIPQATVRWTIPSASFKFIELCSCQVLFSKSVLKGLAQRLSAQPNFKACFSESVFVGAVLVVLFPNPWTGVRSRQGRAERAFGQWLRHTPLLLVQQTTQVSFPKGWYSCSHSKLIYYRGSTHILDDDNIY